MDFPYALGAMRHGERVCRAGWNDKGMWIARVNSRIRFMRALPLRNIEVIELEPFLMMKTADAKYVPWLASQTDMLADDWEIV